LLSPVTNKSTTCLFLKILLQFKETHVSKLTLANVDLYWE